MPIIIVYGGKPPVIINDYNGMFLEDIAVEYEVELLKDSEEDLPPFKFTPSPLM